MGRAYQKKYKLGLIAQEEERPLFPRCFHFCHGRIRSREAALCCHGLSAVNNKDNVVFLSVNTDGAPFQKGQEWQSENFHENALEGASRRGAVAPP